MMNKDNRNDKIRKIAKKGLTFSLCAVLAGGLAAGSFEGVNKLAGWSGATTVEAASNKDETTLTYAKSEKKDADASDSKSDTGKDTGSTAKGSLDVSEIVSEALPSIVSITTKSVQEVQNYFGMYGIHLIIRIAYKSYQRNKKRDQTSDHHGITELAGVLI